MAEKQAAREDFRKRADANKDGKVDGAERAAAGNAVKAAIAAKQGKTGKKPGKAREAIRSRILERFDENKDGQLNETERARMRAAIQSRKTNV